MNPLDYKIVDPDAMRYALLNDAGYKKGGKVSGERLFDEQDKSDWFNKKGERKLPQGDKKIRSPLLRPPKGIRFPVTDPKMEKDEDFSKFPIKKVPVEELYSIQNNVREDNLKPERKHGKPIHVVIWKGKYWVVDGNHRASEFWAANEKHIHAHVLNLDEHTEMEKRIFGGEKVKKYAEGGKVYGSEVPSATPPVEQMRQELNDRSWLDTLGGAGEVGLNFLTGMVAQPAAGIAGAVGETLGLGKGEDIAGRVQSGLTYEPTTAAGQTMSQDLADMMVKSGVASLPPIVSGINPAALSIGPGAARYAGAQAIEAARPLHEDYMAGKLPMVKPASEIQTWHGTPHEIEGNKFSNEKIGTGEGAQAYGIGHYTAESKDLGNVYRRKLTTEEGGKAEHPDQSIQLKIGRLEDQIKQLNQSDNPNAKSMIKAYENRISELDKAGNLYKVEIPDELIAKYLDWDKPFSEQHPDVQKALAKYDPDTYHPSGSDYDENELGQMAYHRIAGKENIRNPSPVSGDRKASQKLNELGIPGIRYLDQGSRGKGGTSNFVTFDPETIKILERNDKPVASIDEMRHELTRNK